MTTMVAPTFPTATRRLYVGFQGQNALAERYRHYRRVKLYRDVIQISSASVSMQISLASGTYQEPSNRYRRGDWRQQANGNARREAKPCMRTRTRPSSLSSVHVDPGVLSAGIGSARFSHGIAEAGRLQSTCARHRVRSRSQILTAACDSTPSAFVATTDSCDRMQVSETRSSPGLRA